jgi:hypothetical protein
MNECPICGRELRKFNYCTAIGRTSKTEFVCPACCVVVPEDALRQKVRLCATVAIKIGFDIEKDIVCSAADIAEEVEKWRNELDDMGPVALIHQYLGELTVGGLARHMYYPEIISVNGVIPSPIDEPPF